MVETKEKAKGTEKKKEISVTSHNTFVEVVALEEGNYKMLFDGEDFLELDEKTIEVLSNENSRNYFIAKGVHSALEKNKKRAADGFKDLQILDPLGGSAVNKLKVSNKDGKRHFCWKRPDELSECEELGYKKVTNEDASVTTQGATGVSSSRILKTKDGKDDLVLMEIPTRVYEQSIHAVSMKSKQRAGASLKELQEDMKKLDRRIELLDTTTETESTVIRAVPTNKE